ncbi:MAG: hypothetical protein FWG75_06005 [Cystobacterineae bacterium]|nr:hypothetical protein [Cystobacterineae bacterium]
MLRRPPPKRTPRTQTRTQTRSTSQKIPAPENLPDGLYGLAMLKLALALKKQPQAPLPQLVAKTLEDLGLSEAGFHHYLEERGQGLEELLMGSKQD